MRIERSMMTIFDVPGIDRIEVATGRPVRVWLSSTDYVDWDQAGLGAVIEALQVARTELLRLNGQPAVPTTPRVFVQGKSIPDDVTTIKDREGDLWRWIDGSWRLRSASGYGPVAHPTTYVLDKWGPVTEVQDAPLDLLRAFVQGDSIPDDVTKIKDNEGDFWYRRNGGWYLSQMGDAHPWTTEEVLGDWGPVTEVRK